MEVAAKQLVLGKPFSLKSLVPIRKGFPRGFFRTVVVLEQIFGPHEENFAAIAFPIAVGSLITEFWTFLHLNLLFKDQQMSTYVLLFDSKGIRNISTIALRLQTQ